MMFSPVKGCGFLRIHLLSQPWPSHFLWSILEGSLANVNCPECSSLLFLDGKRTVKGTVKLMFLEYLVVVLNVVV